MNRNVDETSNIQWVITKPLDTATVYNEDKEKGKQLFKELMKKPIPEPKYKRVIYLNYRNRKNKTDHGLTEPISGNMTIGNVMRAIERGLNRPLYVHHRHQTSTKFRDEIRKSSFKGMRPDWKHLEKLDKEWFMKDIPTVTKMVYESASRWFDSQNRLNIVRQYEDGKLKPKDTMGDHIYFEGLIYDKKMGMYTYGTGS